MAKNVLATKAVLASLNVSLWTARKYDRGVTERVHADYHADADAGRYNKLLVAKEAINELVLVRSRAQNFHLKVTQPWSDVSSGGARILATANYMKHTELRKDKAEYEALADKFALGYPEMVKEAKNRLNGMFNKADYPDVSVIRSKFAFELSYLPCPDPSDFRVSLSKEIMEEMQSDLESRMQGTLDAAMRDARDRCLKVVGHMADKLKNYKPAIKGKNAEGKTVTVDEAEGVFHSSLVQNVRDLAELLPAFNLTGDAKFAKIINRIETQLCELDADELKTNEKERKYVAASAASILKDVEKFMA